MQKLTLSDILNSHTWKAAQFRQKVIRNGGRIPGRIVSRVRGHSIQNGNTGWPREAMQREGYVRLAR